MTNAIDSLGNKIVVGDIIMYATGSSSSCHLNYGVIEKIESYDNSTYNYHTRQMMKRDNYKLKIKKFEISNDVRWHTPDGKYQHNAKCTVIGEKYDEKSVTIQSIDKTIRVTGLCLPENKLMFKLLRERSNKLLCGD